jgi:hypothetical protein
MVITWRRHAQNYVGTALVRVTYSGYGRVVVGPIIPVFTRTYHDGVAFSTEGTTRSSTSSDVRSSTHRIT